MTTSARIVCAAALASSLLRAAEPGPPTLSVGGIHLHDTAEDVQRRLGAPSRRVTSPPNEELGTGEIVELHYSGLKVGLNRPKGQSSFTVNEIHVSSRRWPLSNGIAVGMTRAAIRERLGPGSSQESADRLVYELSGDARLIILLREGLAYTIDLGEEWS